MASCKKFYTTRVDLRPVGMPEEWRIFNAPRPLWGTETWSGEFCKGVLYAAIQPGAEREEWMEEENRRLDAKELVFVDRAAALAAQQKIILDRYGEAEAREYVDDSGNADWLVEQYLDALNDGTLDLPVAARV